MKRCEISGYKRFYLLLQERKNPIYIIVAIYISGYNRCKLAHKWMFFLKFHIRSILEC